MSGAANHENETTGLLMVSYVNGCIIKGPYSDPHCTFNLLCANPWSTNNFH